MKLDFISDPGHGWCKTPVKLLQKLDLVEKITHYSYIRGDYAYLEEDCDLSLLMAAARDKGIALSFRERNSPERPSRVRNYEHYSPGRALARIAPSN